MAVALGRGKRMRLLLGFCLAAVLLFASSPASAVRIVNIYNGPLVADDDTSFFGAEQLESILEFANLRIVADESINVIEVVDMSFGAFNPLGVTLGHLNFQTPTVNLGFDLTVGVGDVLFNAEVATVNLTGRLFGFDGSSTTLLSDPQLTGTATEVNVLGDLAVIQQALDVSVLDATINVLDGLASADLTVSDSRSLRLFGGTLVGDLLAADSSTIDIYGGSFEVDTGSGFQPMGLGELTAQTGTLRGNLQSGDTFEVGFSQGGGGFTGTITLAPEPSTALLFATGLAALGVTQRRRRPDHLRSVR